MFTRETLAESIRAYRTSFPEEAPFIREFLELLKHKRSFYRDHLPGHITGSAWIIDPSGEKALLTHHAKLNRWLQPGGHADGDENIISVALREATEETGLRSLRLLRREIFDLDIHAIPERNDFPAHLHFDVRILLEADPAENVTVTGESHDLAWVAFHQLAAKTGGNLSMARMAAKVTSLRPDQQ